MGFFDGPDIPKAPDTKGLIKDQTKANVGAAASQQQINMVGQVTPTGSLTYKRVGRWPDGTPKYRAVTKLSDDQQGILDSQEKYGQLSTDTGLAQLGNAAEMYSHPIDLSNPSIGNEITDKLRPQFDANMERMRQSRSSELANKGIKEGDPAWVNAMRDFDENQTDSWNRYSVSARDQIVNEMMKQRAVPLDEIAQLTGQGKGTMQGTNLINTPTATVQPTNVAGITQTGYEDQLAAAKMQQDYQNALMGGIAGLGGAAIGGAFTPMGAGSTSLASKWLGL